MGVYAQTNFYIVCKNNKVAKEVASKLNKLAQKPDKDDNTYPKVKVFDDQVEGYLDSGRIQNLEYRCEVMWETIKDIKGVQEMNCPFLSEADGCYYSNE